MTRLVAQLALTWWTVGGCVASARSQPPLAPRALEPLPLGAIAPGGWLLEQLVRQATSLSGHLSSAQGLGGYHGDSNVVNMTRWLGGRGGGPSYISSNDQWFPYWANGNVPLVSLLRAAGALNRLDLPLDEIIDSSMMYVLEHAEPRAGFELIRGALASGGDLGEANCTVAQAKLNCTSNPDCLGITFEAPANTTSVVKVFFKTHTNANSDSNWSSFIKQPGWLSGHLLSEGGTQIIQSLTQWAEDRPQADRKAVAKAVIAHLLYVAAFISPTTVQSWAATRWASVNTLFNYALDILLKEFGNDPEVVPYGLQNTTATLLDGAHRMGRVGFDYAAYYGERPNPRSANKSVPNGSVPVWNVYDHGVNNAEGALRWPSEVYRLNGSLAEGKAAMNLLISQLDKYQAQVQGTMCADEVFCGRDPERGTETCTVVEMMASLEHSFATLGILELQDRVERLAFNALPAALTGDMWTHVYVQQANSVYAGVTHPRSTRGHSHDHAVTAARASAKSCPRGACATESGGPAAFSEIQNTNYYGVSHFPCCITNFPQGWPKFTQSAVLWEDSAEAIVIASLLPLNATVAQANASLNIDTAYPFDDFANVTVDTKNMATTVKIRIPRWATRATVNGKVAPNGTLVSVRCATGRTTIVVDLAPQVIVETGWGDMLSTPATAAVAVTRGPLVFALHPRENRVIVRNFTTVPSHAGDHAPDYLITTDDKWNYALDVQTSAPRYVHHPSFNWSSGFAFDDSGQYPFFIEVVAHEAIDWGYWRGSNITAPPPVSPAASTGPPTKLRLVPFGSTNIRIAVFPTVS